MGGRKGGREEGRKAVLSPSLLGKQQKWRVVWVLYRASLWASRLGKGRELGVGSCRVHMSAFVSLW